MTLAGAEPPLQLLLPNALPAKSLKKKRRKKQIACMQQKKKERKKKRGIVVWCVVNKVILQNSSGSLETSRRHLAELKANIDVVLGKWGSLHRLFSPPFVFGFFSLFFP